MYSTKQEMYIEKIMFDLCIGNFHYFISEGLDGVK